MKSIKFVVTAERGVRSTLEPTINSEKFRINPQHATLKLIQIQNIPSEQRIRAQIEGSFDWITIKDTGNGMMWMKPISEVTKP